MHTQKFGKITKMKKYCKRKYNVYNTNQREQKIIKTASTAKMN